MSIGFSKLVWDHQVQFVAPKMFLLAHCCHSASALSYKGGFRAYNIGDN